MSRCVGRSILVVAAECPSAAKRDLVRAGAMGCVTKDQTADDLVRAVERVGAGGVWFDRSTLAEVVAGLGPGAGAPAGSGAPALTNREVEIVESVAEGLENKQIDTWDDPPDVKILGERMVRLVDRIDAELDVAYRGAVLPKRQGMFGNVKMHVDPSAGPGKWDSVRAMTFKCKTCGGPRLKAGETICPFCDNPMA